MGGSTLGCWSVCFQIPRLQWVISHEMDHGGYDRVGILLKAFQLDHFCLASNLEYASQTFGTLVRATRGPCYAFSCLTV